MPEDTDPPVFLDHATLRSDIEGCRKCPRLVQWRETVSHEKRAAFRDDTYWGRPVAGFGDPNARLLIVGLAPAAHGANRTGRMFTGDRSGEWLFRALHRAGFSNQPTSTSRDDGLVLTDAWLTAAVRCAPPGNRPSLDERDQCRPYLRAEFASLSPTLRVIVALGGFAWDQVLVQLPHLGVDVPRPRPRFGHGAEVHFARDRKTPVHLFASYHPSQQNTFTGKLTESAFDDVWTRARNLLLDPPP